MFITIKNEGNMYSFSKVTLENVIIQQKNVGFDMVVGQAKFYIACPIEITVEDVCKAISDITSHYKEEETISLDAFQEDFVSYLCED